MGHTGVGGSQGWSGVCHVGVGGSCRAGVGLAGVGCVMQEWGGVHHAGVGCVM